VSVAVDAAASGYQRVKREIVRALLAFDASISGHVRLEPGSVLTGCHIVHDSVEIYLMEFQCGLRTLTCPLYAFLPRKQIAESAVPELLQAAAASASL